MRLLDAVVINPAFIDAYIAKKGLRPRISDVQWQTILQRIAALFGRELWHRCRLIHQAEDEWRRYSTAFPDAVPRPYRFIHHLELLACESPQLRELRQWLSEHGVVLRELRELHPESEQDEVVAIQIFGFDPDAAG